MGHILTLSPCLVEPHGKLKYVCVFAKFCKHTSHPVRPNEGGLDVSYINTITLSRRAARRARLSLHFFVQKHIAHANNTNDTKHTILIIIMFSNLLPT
jgi:hypothetical protein